MLRPVTPTLFLDVDGVLSPVRGPSEAWDDWEEMTYDGNYSLVLSRAMASRIARLPVTSVWLTTWRSMANSQIGAWLGWPALPVLEPLDEPASATWKLDRLREHLDGRTVPFVWIDDHLDAMDDDAKNALSGHHLLISPDPAVGLTTRDLEVVERFLDEVLRGS